MSGETEASDLMIPCPRATSTKLYGTPFACTDCLTNSGSFDAVSNAARRCASSSGGVPFGANAA
jgi:hypothetical protein